MRFYELEEQILAESFKDLKTVILRPFIETYGDSNPSPGEFFKKSPDSLKPVINRLARVIKDAKKHSDLVPEPMSFVTVDGLVNHIRFIVKNKRLNDPVIKETNYWIKLVKDDSSLSELFEVLEDAYFSLIQVFNDPRKQKPDAEKFVEREKYTIYKINNYAAARGICNKLNLDWCIGGSNPEWFDDYGKSTGRDTFFAVFKNGTALAIHSGEKSFQVTDHTNSHDFSQFGDGKGRGASAVTIQLANAGLSREERMQLMYDVIHDDLADDAAGDVEFLPALKLNIGISPDGNKIKADFLLGKKQITLTSEKTEWTWTATFNSLLNQKYGAEIDSPAYEDLEEQFEKVAAQLKT